MAFTSTTTVNSVTYQNWGYHVDNTYINNSGGFVGNDDYWEIKKPIDVSYEASIGGSFTISGMTFFESNRTNVNFYSSTSVDSSKRISTVYISSQNQKVNVPSNAKIMILCVRTISPNESASVKVSLRQQVTTWNTSDKAAPTAGTIYDFNGTTNSIIATVYDNVSGTTNYAQIGSIYSYNGTDYIPLYSAETALANLSAGGSGNDPQFTASSSYWNLSGYTHVKFTAYIHSGYARWTGDGYANSHQSYAYLQLNDGTRITIPNASISLGGGGAWAENSKTVNADIDLSSYSSTQRSKVYYGTYRNSSWAVATGMYDYVDGTATNAIAY